MKKAMQKFKKGIASFYIVAFSTLILLIIAVSFATVVISQIARTSNDDLSQSAYDAALAGIEDAKLAFANYRSCLQKEDTKPVPPNGDNIVTCNEIIYWMTEERNCDMVARILGRIGETAPGGEVMISETTSANGNNLNQAYTCVKIETSLSDYRASLSSTTPYKVVRVKLEDKEKINDIKTIRLSWYSNREGDVYNYNNFIEYGGGWRVAFQPIAATRAATPPTMALELIQTASGFTLSELNGMANAQNQTDRATMYFVPSSDKTAVSSSGKNGANAEGSVTATSTYVGFYNGESNYIPASWVAKTNTQTKNLPYAVYCPDVDSADRDGSEEFACSVDIQLPEPIGTKRNPETFMLVAYLPYERPDTDFSIEFLCADGAVCSNLVGGENETVSSNLLKLNGVQTLVDSTGRANDLFRRVEMRMETTDAGFPYPLYAIEATDNGSSVASIEKELSPQYEYETNYGVDDLDFGSIKAEMKSVTIYPRILGVDYPSGLAGFTFNVYANGSLIAKNAMTWRGSVLERTVLRVELNEKYGYSPVNARIERTVEENTLIKPEWEEGRFPVEVATVINGEFYDRGFDGFTFDVSIDGALVASNVTYFARDDVKYGSRVVVTPSNKSSACNGSVVSATVEGETYLSATWNGQCVPEVTVQPVVGGRSGAREGFTFSVYLNGSSTPIANNVEYFSEKVAAGSSVRIVANDAVGHTLAQKTIVLSSVTESTTATVNWIVNYYPVTILPIIDGEERPGGLAGFTFDVYLDGELASDRTNIIYYNKNVAYGTEVRVVPHPAPVDAGDYVDPFEITEIVPDHAITMNPLWHKGFYPVDVNTVANGTVYANGVYGLWFDVRVTLNGMLWFAAWDVQDFYMEKTPWGSVVEVTVHDADGYTLATPSFQKTIISDTEFRPTWNGKAVYSVDVNEVVNGTTYSNGYNGFSFAMLMNGSVVASGVTDWFGYVVRDTSARVLANAKDNYRLTDGDVTKAATANLVFTPTWRQGVTTIRYNANGGSGAVSSQTVRSGESVTINSNTGGFSRTGYDFNGWNTAANGSGESYGAGSIFTATSLDDNTIDLYAQWKIKTYNITIRTSTGINNVKLNGTTCYSTSGCSITLNYGQSYILTATAAANYVFTNWSNSAGVGTIGNTNSNSTNYTVGVGNTTLTANAKIDKAYMQEFTNAQCQSLASSGNYTVYDRRDNNSYTVRYINGRCWMTQNLRTSGIIYAADSNFSSGAFDITADVHFSNSVTSPQSYYAGSLANGAYYNYCAATAGTVCVSYDANASQDVCPANWRMPTIAEYAAIVNNGDFNGKFSPVYSGWVYDGSLTDNVGGSNRAFWWTSDSHSQGVYQYILLYLDGSVSIDNGLHKQVGGSLRCVRK